MMTEYDLARDARALEPHFTKHMSAMAGDGLYSKSDIACELAYRDQEIDRLNVIIKDLLNQENNRIKGMVDDYSVLEAKLEEAEKVVNAAREYVGIFNVEKSKDFYPELQELFKVIKDKTDDQ